MVSRCKPGKCARSSGWKKRASAETGHGQKGRDSPVHWPEVCRLCAKSPHADAGLGGERRGRPGSLAHTDTMMTVPGGPSCRGVLLASGGGYRQGPRRALVDGGLWLVTHPGKPKALR